MNNKVNIQPILNFTKRYESAVIGKSKEIRLTIEEAGLLTAAIVNLLSIQFDDLLANVKKIETPETQIDESEQLEVYLDAGTFKN